MAALVESMFYVRETPWHGMGTRVENAPTSKDAIVLSGLDWDVRPEKMYLANGNEVPDSFANVRESDGKILGTVGNKYQIVQNKDAFTFSDGLIGEGCIYETAGSLRDGKTIWLLAHLPEAIQIAGDDVMPYLCFTNTHDGTGSVRCFVTPIRVVCNNTLNYSVNNAKRVWSARHTGSVINKMDEARTTLLLADKYLNEVKKESEILALKSLDNDKLIKMIDMLIPVDVDMSDKQKDNLRNIKNDIWYRYTFAPDLKDREQSFLRFIHAVADSENHMEPIRKTAKYADNHMIDMVSGGKLLDKAFMLAKVA